MEKTLKYDLLDDIEEIVPDVREDEPAMEDFYRVVFHGGTGRSAEQCLMKAECAAGAFLKSFRIESLDYTGSIFTLFVCEIIRDARILRKLLKAVLKASGDDNIKFLVSRQNELYMVRSGSFEDDVLKIAGEMFRFETHGFSTFHKIVRGDEFGRMERNFPAQEIVAQGRCRIDLSAEDILRRQMFRGKEAELSTQFENPTGPKCWRLVKIRNKYVGQIETGFKYLKLEIYLGAAVSMPSGYVNDMTASAEVRNPGNLTEMTRWMQCVNEMFNGNVPKELIEGLQMLRQAEERRKRLEMEWKFI